MFPHNEYHIYTTASGIEFRHVHLTVEQLAQAKHLDSFVHGDVDGDWQHQHRLPVDDNVYLSVGDVFRSPSLQSRGYEGWETCQAGEFEESVFIEGMIFHKCTTRAGSDFDPDWDVDDTRSKILPEHRDKFDRELEEYVEETDRKL